MSEVKKSKNKIIGVILILSPLLFFLPEISFGQTYFFNSDQANQNTWGSTGSQGISTRYIPPVNQVICGFGFEIARQTSTLANFDIEVRQGGTDPQNGFLVSSIYDESNSGWLFSTSSVSFYNYTFPGCFNGWASSTFWFNIRRSTSLDSIDFRKGIGLGAASSTQNQWLYNGSVWTETDPAQNLSLRVFGAATSTNASFVYPVNNMRTPDFLKWTISLNGFSSTTVDRFLTVNFSQTSSTVDSDKFNTKQIGSGNYQGQQISFDKTISFNTTSSDQIWFARVRVYEGDTIKYQSEVISFTVFYNGGVIIQGAGGGNPTDLGLPEIERENDCSQYHIGLFSSSTGQAIQCYVRDAIFWFGDILFVPATSSVRYFQTSVEDFQDSFPFNLIYGVKNTIASTTAAVSAAQMDLTFPLPWGSNISFLNSSTLAQFMTDSTDRTLWLDTISGVIWITTILAMYFML